MKDLDFLFRLPGVPENHAIATTVENVISVSPDSFATLAITPVKRGAKTASTMIFAQRFIESFKVRAGKPGSSGFYFMQRRIFKEINES